MEWVSIKEKNPEDDQTVLGWKKDQTSELPIICYYDAASDIFVALFTLQELYADIDYWMPIPHPPKY